MTAIVRNDVYLVCNVIFLDFESRNTQKVYKCNIPNIETGYNRGVIA